MPFHTDKQRKAFFASKGNPKSNINPSFSERISNIKEKLRLRRERLGKERIEKEKIALKQEQEQAKRLQKEAEVEIQRERVKQKTLQAQRELKEVERARFKRSRLGRVTAGAVSLGKKGFKELKK